MSQKTISEVALTSPLLCWCPVMKAQLTLRCEQHGDECPDQVVRQSKQSGRLFLVAANATYDLQFCPWCGTHIQKPQPDSE